MMEMHSASHFEEIAGLMTLYKIKKLIIYILISYNLFKDTKIKIELNSIRLTLNYHIMEKKHLYS